MKPHHVTGLPALRLAALCAGLALAGCQDDAPQTPTGPTVSPTPTTSAPPAPSSGRLRVAQLTLDARSIDLAVDGQVVARNVPYPGASSYVELLEGTHRVQIFPAGRSGAALVENNVFVPGGQLVTVAVVGNDPVSLVTMTDDANPQGDRTIARFFNTVSDFPANLDFGIANGPDLSNGVAYLQATGYTVLLPGEYAFVLRRGGTREELATETAVLPGAMSVTVFAVGTLARDDIALFVARDDF